MVTQIPKGNRPDPRTAAWQAVVFPVVIKQFFPDKLSCSSSGGPASRSLGKPGTSTRSRRGTGNPSCYIETSGSGKGKVYWSGAIYNRNKLYNLVLPVTNRKDVMKKFHKAAAGVKVIISNRDPLGIKEIVRKYFSGIKPVKTVPLDLAGHSSFALKILRTASRIPYGQVWSYKQLAQKAGMPKAARAAGTVMAGNRLPLFIPCHRVIKSNGELGNFSGSFGPELKKIMLKTEGRNI